MFIIKAVKMEDKFHIGRLIKSVFEQKEMSVSEFARQIHCERTNVYTIFNRSSIDVELLVRISKVLEHNFLEDVINEFGLSSTFRPQLHLHIDLNESSSRDADRLLHVLSKMIEENKTEKS